jgi:hypothetical protein
LLKRISRHSIVSAPPEPHIQAWHRQQQANRAWICTMHEWTIRLSLRAVLRINVYAGSDHGAGTPRRQRCYTDSALNPLATGPLPAAKPRPSSPLPVTFLGIARSSLAFLLIAGVSVTRPDKGFPPCPGGVENGTGPTRGHSGDCRPAGVIRSLPSCGRRCKL